MAKYKVDITGVNTNDLTVLSNDEMIELFKEYHKPNTMIEYYSNEIKLLFEEGKCVVYAE